MDQDRATQEWRAIGRLAGKGLGSMVGVVRDTHAAIVDRVEAQLPPSAAGVIASERAISSLVYGAVDAAHRAVPAAAAEVAAAARPDTAPPPSRTKAGQSAQAAVNGLWGDRVHTDDPVLAVPMGIRVDGTDVPATPDALAHAFPHATGDLVVLVHGLGEDERAWRLAWEGDSTSYGDRLAADEGCTPITVRYTSGRRISDNGRDLAELLGQVHDAWPVEITSISIVGHSMGGLVARSAVHQADGTGAPWTQRLRTLVSLGSPHLGAPLERAAHVLDRALRIAPESEPIGRILATRSVGIKDLRYGALLEQDWDGRDPDEFLRDTCAVVPLLPHVTYCWVAASLTKDARHPLGVLLGDGLVRYGSASGNGHHTRVGFPIDNGLHVTGVGHLRLLNHPAVYDQLRSWLTAPMADWAGGPG